MDQPPPLLDLPPLDAPEKLCEDEADGMPALEMWQYSPARDAPAIRPKHPHDGHKGFTECDHESRQRQRTKQIIIGKSTEGYQNYLERVPRECRIPGVHLDTPPVSPCKNVIISKRDFEHDLRVWRRFLHRWDDDAPERAPLTPADKMRASGPAHLRRRKTAGMQAAASLQDGLFIPPQEQGQPSEVHAGAQGPFAGDAPWRLHGGDTSDGSGWTGAHAVGSPNSSITGRFWSRCVSKLGWHNVRAQPTFGAPVLTRLPAGAMVCFSEVHFGADQWWGRTDGGTGTEGFVLIRDGADDYMVFSQGEDGPGPTLGARPPPPTTVSDPDLGLGAVLAMQLQAQLASHLEGSDPGGLTREVSGGFPAEVPGGLLGGFSEGLPGDVPAEMFGGENGYGPQGGGWDWGVGGFGNDDMGFEKHPFNSLPFGPAHGHGNPYWGC
eukprot:TRINITY_DN19524_c0_g1_i1.p1 TRINITY_DN19524_c0_g1~~TRINITY_DN19524_c0_g1_i1.p1  ORF type:complete len:467 (+),score=86.24 TRINITY_DN19524_c0_g1_i1:93-1403(+)